MSRIDGFSNFFQSIQMDRASKVNEDTPVKDKMNYSKLGKLEDKGKDILKVLDKVSSDLLSVYNTVQDLQNISSNKDYKITLESLMSKRDDIKKLSDTLEDIIFSDINRTKKDLGRSLPVKNESWQMHYEEAPEYDDKEDRPDVYGTLRLLKRTIDRYTHYEMEILSSEDANYFHFILHDNETKKKTRVIDVSKRMLFMLSTSKIPQFANDIIKDEFDYPRRII